MRTIRGAQVQAGVARTGKWWGHQHVSGEAVEPDILIFAKGIASGFPFAGGPPATPQWTLFNLPSCNSPVQSQVYRLGPSHQRRLPASQHRRLVHFPLAFFGGVLQAESTQKDISAETGLHSSPHAGLATRDNMFDGLALGTMGGTYGAAPLACATANATLDVIVEENLLENSTQRGLQLVEVGASAALYMVT